MRNYKAFGVKNLKVDSLQCEVIAETRCKTVLTGSKKLFNYIIIGFKSLNVTVTLVLNR